MDTNPLIFVVMLHDGMTSTPYTFRSWEGVVAWVENQTFDGKPKFTCLATPHPDTGDDVWPYNRAIEEADLQDGRRVTIYRTYEGE